MAQGPARGIGEDPPFTIDGVEFVPAWARPSTPGSFSLQKAARMVDAYQRLVARYPAPRMVELGIFQGGSVAMLTLLARPSRFVAIEYRPDRIEALDVFIADRGLGGVVRPHYGVDQADRGRLEAILAEDLGQEPLDLVIDDASHRYAETVASFEVLFPRLAPGGRYVIEDWTCDDTTTGAMARALADEGSEVGARLRAAFEEASEEVASAMVSRPEPLSRLGLELVLARAASGGAVASVQVDEDWIEVVRGDGPLDPATFRLRDVVPDHYHLLRPAPDDPLATRPRPEPRPPRRHRGRRATMGDTSELAGLDVAGTVDHLAVERLQRAYADAVTCRDWARASDLFLPDATVTLDLVTRPGRELEGVDEIVGFISSAVDDFEFFEFAIVNAHNEVWPDGDRSVAAGRIFMCELRVRRGERERDDAFGLYRDDYRKVDGQWHIARRLYRSIARFPEGAIFGLPPGLGTAAPPSA